VSDPILPIDDGSTPLRDDEREGLKLSYVTTRGDLNVAEQANILEAEDWAIRRERDVPDRNFLNDLHAHMFGNVWNWAGSYRRTGKNIGVDAYRIPTDLQQLIDNCSYWIEHETYPPDEIAARFHHRLVQIHAYPNGNGRHARLATDLLLKQMDCARFTWGSASLTDRGATRRMYIDALRAADNHEYGPLMEFVRS
jgi:Fic-DOC domain mobile mystery protein B